MPVKMSMFRQRLRANTGLPASVFYTASTRIRKRLKSLKQVWFGSEKDKSKNYKATIEGQKAGTKVTFQILAVSAYSVYTFSEVYEYTVQEESEPEPMPNPEAN